MTGLFPRVLMRYLLFMDGLRQNAIWVLLAILLCLATLLIWSPGVSNGWKRRTSRAIGSVLLVMLAIFSIPVIFFSVHAEPREHFGFTTANGSRVALLSHSELRDGAATEVTVKAGGCCSRFIAYRYFGDGDDYMGAKSIEWVDEHHLAIRFVRDPSGTQQCFPKVGDIAILCEPQPDPFP
jgi:hypothetical protein